MRMSHMQEQIIRHCIFYVIMQVLSVQQLYKICTQYWDDKYNTESVSEEVSGESPMLSCLNDNHESWSSLFTECDAVIYSILQNSSTLVPLFIQLFISSPYIVNHPKAQTA